MSNYSALKTDINNNIYENNTQQITGTVLNTVLKDMVNTLGAGYQFAGCAYLDLNPGAPDAKVFYLAGEGLYPNFDNIQVPAGKLGILKWDTRWRLETIEGLGGGGANLTGYISLPSVSDLPEEGQPTIGYLIGENLYLYVGEGGDTADGKYQNCGGFRGPEGVSITDIEQVVESVENGGRNTIRITLSDGHSYDVYVRNGKASQGLFPDAATLNAQRPNPSVGEYAFVGSGFPADIYVCNTAGTWTDSGADYDGDSVDLTDYATKAELNQLEAEKADKDTVRAYMMTIRAKQALLAVFNKVAFAFPDVSAEMDELENSLFNLDEIVGIEATYNQGDTVVYDQGVNTLDELKDNLIVKAVYGDGTKVPVQSYTLSGDITVAGTQTITAFFLGFTDTFEVEVTHYTAQMIYKMTDSDISKITGSLTRRNDNTEFCIDTTNSSRRSFVAPSGDTPIVNSSGTSINKYPIPLPRNARKVTVSVTPSATLNVSLGIGYLQNGVYAYTTGSAFSSYTQGSYTRTFTAENFDRYRKGGWFVFVGCSPVSSFSGNEPTELVVTFE